VEGRKVVSVAAFLCSLPARKSGEVKGYHLPYEEEADHL
jgi:hypothetical protein